MSRSGYIDDVDDRWSYFCWRGAVQKALSGARGQSFLKEMLAALDSLPERKLIANELEEDGAVCAIGAVGKSRGIDMSGIDPEDRDRVAELFDIAPALAAEIVYANDEGNVYPETPEHRYTRMRKWITRRIK